MTSPQELNARLKDFFKFTKQEISGLVLAAVIVTFIFAFDDGRESFDLFLWLWSFILVLVIVFVTFLVRISFQKFYAISEGYSAEFKVWLVGLIISLVIGIISGGKIPLVLIGGMVASFMVRHRLGEFRYGFSHMDNAMIGVMGIVGNVTLAILFAIGLRYFPQNFFFSKGLTLNIYMGILSLLPLPQLDGLNIFWGSRTLYYLTTFLMLLFAVLLLSKTIWGLVISIILLTTGVITFILISSEK